VVVAAFLFFFLREGETPLDVALARAGIPEPVNERVSLNAAEEWKPAAGADGYALAVENDAYALYVRPDNTQIALVDKKTGYRWTSNPAQEQLTEETVKGQLLTNLQSPFVLTYVTTEGKDQTNRKAVDALDKKLKAELSRTANALQVTYTYAELGLTFSLEYELTEDGFKARVPTNGIKEEGKFVVFSLDVLPFFGAAKVGEDGYMFVPDGPGGLIRFKGDRANISKGYIHQVYGLEPTNMINFDRSGERREDISYPVFGVKRGDQAFVAVISKGGDSSNIAAMPPGIKSSFYNVFTNQIYREDYLYMRSRESTPVKAVQKKRLETDREIEYRFLKGDKADYVGMADAYRDYLSDNGMLGEPLKPVKNIPLYLKVMGGTFNEAYGRVEYFPATTFDQATDMVKGLQDRGVDNIEVIYYGWQNMGGYQLDDRFPIEKKLGGTAGAKAFIDEMKKRDIDVQFYDDFVWLNTENTGLSPKSSGIRGVDGTVSVFEGWFLSKPARTVDMSYKAIQKLKDIGVSGVLYDWVGEMIFHDYDPTAIATRGDTVKIYSGLLDYTRKTLGWSGVYRGNDYSLANIDYIMQMQYESSFDFMIDETVPFYPIVVHGYVPYSFNDGNLRNDVEAEFLKAIEYGAMPSFYLTHEESRKLRDGGMYFLFNSQYEKWADRIGAEYKQFDQLAKAFAQRIIDHEKLAEDRFATTYEDGTRVIVDYGKKTFEIEKGAGS